MTTTIPATAQLLELRTKLTNLVDNVEDRLDDEHADRQYLLEGLLDRLAELATGIMPAPPTHVCPSTGLLCGLCGHLAATAHVTAGTPGTDIYRNTPVCTHCTLPAITAAAPAGDVHITPILPNRQEVTR